jgi:hypothetical protein
LARIDHSAFLSIRLERPLLKSTIAKSTVMTHLTLREDTQSNPTASPASVELMALCPHFATRFLPVAAGA